MKRAKRKPFVNRKRHGATMRHESAGFVALTFILRKMPDITVNTE